MDWYKIKSILIALFLLINILLLGLIFYNSVKDSRTDRMEIESAVKVMKLNNINISPDQVDSKPSKAYSITILNPMTDAGAFAEKMLGGTPSLQGKEYLFESKKLKINGINFIYENTLYKEAGTPSRKLVKSAKKELVNMGFDMKYSKSQIKNNTIIFTQRVHGNELFGSKLSVTACDKGIITVTGSWAEVSRVSSSDVVITSAAEVLIAFLRDENRPADTSDIISVKYGAGLTLDASDYRTAETVPLWKITLKNGKEFFYDARK